MGVFDFLAHKKPAPGPPEPPLSPCKQNLQTATDADDFEWDFDNAPSGVLVTQLLTQAAPSFGDA